MPNIQEYPETRVLAGTNLPKFVVEIPIDLFSGGTHSTTKRQAEGYLLYSIGLNRVDDKGRDDPTANCDDLTIRVPAEKKAEEGNAVSLQVAPRCATITISAQIYEI